MAVRGHRRDGASDDRGSLTAELVVIAPVIVAAALLIVAFGRVQQAHGVVNDAARAGAEVAAVQGYASAAQLGAYEATWFTLTKHHMACTGSSVVRVDTSAFRPGGWVTVDVTCTVRLSDVAVPGLPGSTTVTASATAPVDPYVGIT